MSMSVKPSQKGLDDKGRYTLNMGNTIPKADRENEASKVAQREKHLPQRPNDLSSILDLM